MKKRPKRASPERRNGLLVVVYGEGGTDYETVDVEGEWEEDFVMMFRLARHPRVNESIAKIMEDS